MTRLRLVTAAACAEESPSDSFDERGAPVAAVVSTAEQKSEEELVTAAVDASGSEGLGSCGTAATLEAIWRGEVRTLLVANGLTAAGSECAIDGRLYPDGPGPCPLCGAETLPVADIVDRAAQLTLEHDGDVEIVHERAAQRLRDGCDGIGAVLRFRQHA